MNHFDIEYNYLANIILRRGVKKQDRTGVGTLSIFGHKSEFDLSTGSFPLLTTKKIRFDSVVKELLWLLRGETNIKTLGCGIWDEWADENGDLGPIYGHQWRNKSVDQIAELVKSLSNDPDSRRHVVNSWDVDRLHEMKLSPCHAMFQCYVSNGTLDLQLYQRSADTVLGVPFNIASYSLLLLMLSRRCGLKPGRFIHTFGDAHVYLNHVEGLKKQLERTVFKSPSIKFHNDPKTELWDYRLVDIELIGYQHHPFIKFEVAV